MSLSKQITILFFLFFIIVNPSFVFAEASPAIPTPDPAYQDLEWLISLDLIEDHFRGRKPLTRAEFARLFGQAMQKSQDQSFSKKVENALQAKMARLQKRFYNELVQQGFLPGEKVKAEIRLLDTFRFETTIMDSDPRPYFYDTQIDGIYNPFVNFEEGRNQNSGWQNLTETEHWLRYKDFFALYFRPRYQLQFEDAGDTVDGNLSVQEAYLSFEHWNTQVDFGIKNLQWGLGQNGGVVLSNNAKAFPLMQIYNFKPYRLGFLGKFRYHVFLGKLNHDQRFQDPWISGVKLSLKPHRTIELSIARTLIFGGEGAPDASAFDYLSEYFGFRPGDITLRNLSNSINGVEFSFWVPKLRGTQVYSEIYFDDIDGAEPIKRLKQDSAIRLGVFLPRLDEAGTWNLRLEAKRLEHITYRHDTWRAGWTQSQRVLGEPVGPDSESLSLFLTKSFDAKWLAQYEFHFEDIESDVYTVNANGDRVVLIDGLPERRFRNELAVTTQWQKNWQTQVRAGYEFVDDFNFNAGDNRHNFLFSLGIKVNFDDHFKMVK